MLRTMCAFVIVDMPPHFDDVVLALLEEADDVFLVASMDIPSIKNLKVGIQTLGLLSLAGPKLRLVLNRANAKVNLDIADVERAIGHPRPVPHAFRHRGPAGGEPRRARWSSTSRGRPPRWPSVSSPTRSSVSKPKKRKRRPIRNRAGAHGGVPTRRLPGQ